VLAAWYRAFLSVIEKYAPLQRKRVKPYTSPVVNAMKILDKLKREKTLEDTNVNVHLYGTV